MFEENPFYLEKNRAMISLGSFNEEQHCVYNCAFCYVQDGFNSYSKLCIEDILIFLKKNREKYKIIYISGDTDSFAHPRTEEALKLMYDIVAEINCDLLFTTRTTFSENQFLYLNHIINKQKQKNKKLFACVSITRISNDFAYLEPTPIPTPKERIDVLKKLNKIGAITVLALRPLLPIVDITDYLKIINEVKDFIDIILGESFYFKSGGNVEKRVFLNGIPNECEKDILIKQIMSFDKNKEPIWNIWQANEIKNIIKLECDKLNIIFSMHSDDAINEFVARNTVHK